MISLETLETRNWMRLHCRHLSFFESLKTKRDLESYVLSMKDFPLSLYTLEEYCAKKSWENRKDMKPSLLKRIISKLLTS